MASVLVTKKALVNTAYSQGQRLLTNADIAAGIQVRIAQMTMSADVRKCQV